MEPVVDEVKPAADEVIMAPPDPVKASVETIATQTQPKLEKKSTGRLEVEQKVVTLEKEVEDLKT